MIHIFWYFLLGMLTVSYIFPLLDKIEEIVLTYLELVKGKMTVKITELNCQITKLQESDESPKTIIGFAAPEEKDDKE